MCLRAHKSTTIVTHKDVCGVRGWWRGGCRRCGEGSGAAAPGSIVGGAVNWAKKQYFK